MDLLGFFHRDREEERGCRAVPVPEEASVEEAIADLASGACRSFAMLVMFVR